MEPPAWGGGGNQQQTEQQGWGGGQGQQQMEQQGWGGGPTQQQQQQHYGSQGPGPGGWGYSGQGGPAPGPGASGQYGPSPGNYGPPQGQASGHFQQGYGYGGPPPATGAGGYPGGPHQMYGQDGGQGGGGQGGFGGPGGFGYPPSGTQPYGSSGPPSRTAGLQQESDMVIRNMSEVVADPQPPANKGPAGQNAYPPDFDQSSADVLQVNHGNSPRNPWEPANGGQAGGPVAPPRPPLPPGGGGYAGNEGGLSDDMVLDDFSMSRKTLGPALAQAQDVNQQPSIPETDAYKAPESGKGSREGSHEGSRGPTGGTPPEQSFSQQQHQPDFQRGLQGQGPPVGQTGGYGHSPPATGEVTLSGGPGGLGLQASQVGSTMGRAMGATGTMGSAMGGVVVGAMGYDSAGNMEEIQRLREMSSQKEKDKNRLQKKLTDQRRRLEDQMVAARREAENSGHDLKQVRQELEDTKQSLLTAQERLRLGESAAVAAARAADEAAKRQLEVVKTQAETAKHKAIQEKEELLQQVKNDMEEKQMHKGKKWGKMLEEVKSEREKQHSGLQKELEAEAAVRVAKEKELLSAKAEVEKLQEEIRRGTVSVRDSEDVMNKMKNEMTDLRQKSNAHALEKLEQQKGELKLVQGSLSQTQDAVQALKSDLAPLAKRVALMSEEIGVAKGSLQTNAEALVAGVKVEITELERKLAKELDAASKKLQNEMKMLRNQLEEVPQSQTCAIC
ncbi:hypothetical protein CYMTET_43464 [Cymbomonas tetramitiformis]|uniref:Uncharacterized protein n=1 Tax=Cymbomonas tetramitiformis TaxID=36881 RepID=A0AAE0C264_9CHLO|nr:hypothetical protein CYMTET_43464 [Cymbomonas tetramitiformis]